MTPFRGYSFKVIPRPFHLVFLAAIVFLIAAFVQVRPLPVDVPVGYRFDWPDETANFFWSRSFAETGALQYFEPLNLAAENQIYPRSFNVRPDGTVVPGSFLGMVLLYGTLGKIVGSSAIMYITPVLSFFGCLALYGILRKLFDPPVALISVLLLLVHPAWWYYTVTSMLPNVGFLSLLIISVYFLFEGKSINYTQAVLSGIFLGIAMSFRPSEIVWVGIVYLFVFYYWRAELGFSKLFVLLGAAFIASLPVFYQQQAVYGSIFSSGYQQLHQTTSCAACAAANSLLLPFGLHPNLALDNFWNYVVMLFWSFGLFPLGGVALFIKRGTEQRSSHFGYALLAIPVFLWIIAYYGSWQFSDQMTTDLNTLGISYVRYFLPLYVIMLPFVAMAVWRLATMFSRFRFAVATIVIVGFAVQSAFAVLWLYPDSIMPVKQRIAEYRRQSFEVMLATESEAVIITSRKDKVLFPDRRVIHTFPPLQDNEDLQRIVLNLSKINPVYYLSLELVEDVELNNGLTLKYSKEVGNSVLYRIQ